MSMLGISSLRCWWYILEKIFQDLVYGVRYERHLNMKTLQADKINQRSQETADSKHIFRSLNTGGWWLFPSLKEDWLVFQRKFRWNGWRIKQRTLPWVYQSSFLAVSLWDRAMVSSILKSHMPQIRSASTLWNISTYPLRSLWWLECSWAGVCWALGTLHICLGLPLPLSQESLLFLFSKPPSKWEGSFAGSSLWAWFQKMTYQSLIIWLSKSGPHLIETRKSDPSFHGMCFLRKNERSN